MVLEHFSYGCNVRRGPGGPRDSRPGGRRYLFFQRPATLSQAGDPLYTKRQNALALTGGYQNAIPTPPPICHTSIFENKGLMAGVYVSIPRAWNT